MRNVWNIRTLSVYGNNTYRPTCALLGIKVSADFKMVNNVEIVMQVVQECAIRSLADLPRLTVSTQDQNCLAVIFESVKRANGNQVV